ncbi:MAG: hypothetical protein A2231_01080 [Candidatus Firestonebacteria bacterium RIFOXYA2_FULL_40_8]|nr:MAG: hypothetical protein A2231_01080 [Candidatus Firestonebacteria bacterium RIFOXYA2_FULL_40_8]
MSKNIGILALAVIIAFVGCSKVILKPEERSLQDKAVIAIEAAKKEIKEAEKIQKSVEMLELFNTAKEKVTTAESFMGISNFEKACWFADQAKEAAGKVRAAAKP